MLTQYHNLNTKIDVKPPLLFKKTKQSKASNSKPPRIGNVSKQAVLLYVEILWNLLHYHWLLYRPSHFFQTYWKISFIKYVKLQIYENKHIEISPYVIFIIECIYINIYFYMHINDRRRTTMKKGRTNKRHLSQACTLLFRSQKKVRKWRLWGCSCTVRAVEESGRQLWLTGNRSPSLLLIEIS